MIEKTQISLIKKSRCLKWIIPVIFVVGQVIISIKTNSFNLQYAGLTTGLVICSVLLLSRISPFSADKLPIWILLLVIIITYFTQFYWILLNPEVTTSRWFYQLHWLASSEEVRFKAFFAACCGFITFCITAYMLISKPNKPEETRFKDEINYKSVLTVLSWLIAVFIIVTSYIIYVTGVGRMGAETIYLLFLRQQSKKGLNRQ